KEQAKNAHYNQPEGAPVRMAGDKVAPDDIGQASGTANGDNTHYEGSADNAFPSAPEVCKHAQGATAKEEGDNAGNCHNRRTSQSQDTDAYELSYYREQEAQQGSGGCVGPEHRAVYSGDGAGNQLIGKAFKGGD